MDDQNDPTNESAEKSHVSDIDQANSVDCKTNGRNPTKYKCIPIRVWDVGSII